MKTSRAQNIVALLASACLVAIPVCMFAGMFRNVSGAAGCGLTIIWCIALIVAFVAGQPSTPEYPHCSRRPEHSPGRNDQETP